MASNELPEFLRFIHPPYLSEEQISDQLEHQIADHFGDTAKVLREQTIGTIRPDFLVLRSKVIEIVEVKITANLDTIKQLCLYKKIVENHLLCLSITEGVIKTPPIGLNIYARNFDSECMDLIQAFYIGAHRVFVDSKKKVTSEYIDFDCFINKKEDQKFDEILKSHYWTPENV